MFTLQSEYKHTLNIKVVKSIGCDISEYTYTLYEVYLYSAGRFWSINILLIKAI